MFLLIYKKIMTNCDSVLGHDDVLAASAKVAAKTDILRTIDMVEDASAKAEKGRKKTPPSGSQKTSTKEKNKADIIKELGRRPSHETISLYRKSSEVSNADRRSESPGKRLSEERKSPSVERDSLPSASKQFMMDRMSMDVPTDILNTIQEERTKTPSDIGDSIDSRKDSTESESNNASTTVGQRLADRRKFPFNR